MRINRSAIILGAVVGAATIVPSLPATAAEPAPWSIVELQPLTEGNHVQVWDINASGTSVGWEIESGRAVSWDADGEPTALPLPEECTNSTAEAISPNGHITGLGFCTIDEQPVVSGIVWDPDGATHLIGAGTNGTGVQDGGIAVADIDGEQDHAAAFAAGKGVLPLNESGAASSKAADINGIGYIVGTLSGFDVEGAPATVAVGHFGTSTFPLIKTSIATEGVAVNEKGVALVKGTVAEGETRGALVKPGGGLIYLDQSGDSDNPVDVNDSNVVVGTKTFAEDDVDGVFFAAGGSLRLSDVVDEETADAWDLSAPVAINNSNNVVGNDGARAWLLVPAS